MGSHEFLDLALVIAHDGLKAAGLQNDTTSDENDVVAAGQKRDAVRNKDPSFCCQQSAGPNDIICEEVITQMTSTRVQCRPTIDMTSDVGIDSCQYIVQ